MKIKYYISLSVAMLLSAAAATAQTPENVAFGYIVRQQEFKIADIYNISKFNTNMGTARTAAMAGAFTSLGADLSSMNINPAGLGMYQASEFGITGSLMFNNVKSTVPGERSTTGSRTSVGLNNVGFAFNTYQGSGSLTSFTIGFNYNRIADYNYRSTIDLPPAGTSILDMFVPMIDLYTKDNWHGALDGSTPWNSHKADGAFLEEWGAILAYKTGLIRRETGKDTYYTPTVENAHITQYLNTVSKGNAGEYSFSGGWNVSNKFYIGVTLGIVDYNHNQTVEYSESYDGNTAEASLAAARMHYRQRIKTYGEGWNAKLGMIFRPTPELRIGLAVHSPNIVTLRTRYNSTMVVNYANGINEIARSPHDREYTEKFYTPTRLLGGVSYAFGDRAVVALDYEHTFYSGMRMRGDGYDRIRNDGRTDKEWYKDAMKADFRGAHTIRFGTEVRPAANLFVRAGFAYVCEGLSEDLIDGNNFFEIPAEKSSVTISAGLGYRFSPRTAIDLTYVYSGKKYTIYDMYYYHPESSTSMDTDIHVSNIGTNRNLHNVMLSFNYRF